MAELVFLKLGGSVITDKAKKFTIREHNIRRIASEIKQALSKKKDLKLVIGHGGGSFPHYPAKKYGVHKGIIHKDSWKGFTETRSAASKLNQLVTEIFLEEGVGVVSFQPSSSAICDNGKLVHLDVRQIRHLLKHNQIPVTYGDAVLDQKKGCTIVSTEQLFVYLSHKLLPDRIILVGEVDGVYTADPHKHKNAQLIPEISNYNFDEIKKMLTGSHGYDVTGGMFTKIKNMYDLVEIHPRMTVKLVSGEAEGRIKDALLNNHVIGTSIVYKGESPIPKLLFLDINGVVMKQGTKPGICFVEDLYKSGFIKKDVWDNELIPIFEKYKAHAMSREDIVKVATIGHAVALKSADYEKVLEVAAKTMERIKKDLDPYIVNLIKYAKGVRKYKVYLLSTNFGEIASLVGDAVGADVVYAPKLKTKDGKITGELEGEIMTPSGKTWAVRDAIKKTHSLKERTMYVGDSDDDWKAMQECGVKVLWQPNLRTNSKMSLEEKEWIDEVLMVLRGHEISNLLVVTGKPTTKLEHLLE